MLSNGPNRTWLPAVMAALLAVAAARAQSSPSAKPPLSKITTEMATDHLNIRYTNTLKAKADGSVAFALDITPRAGMHVYAPGADDYQIISMAITGQPGLRMRPLKYPPSEIYHFEPLDERIPVYQKPFTLVLETVLEEKSTAVEKGARIDVAGRLDYQACDDKVCFAPASVPLSWTIIR